MSDVRYVGVIAEWGAHTRVMHENGSGATLIWCVRITRGNLMQPRANSVPLIKVPLKAGVTNKMLGLVGSCLHGPLGMLTRYYKFASNGSWFGCKWEPCQNFKPISLSPRNRPKEESEDLST